MVSFTGALTDIGHHRFYLAGERVRERADHLVLAERPAVELVDPVLDEEAGLGRDVRRKLAGVVLLHAHDTLRLSQDVADLLRGERAHEAALEEVDLLALLG